MFSSKYEFHIRQFTWHLKCIWIFSTDPKSSFGIWVPILLPIIWWANSEVVESLAWTPEGLQFDFRHYRVYVSDSSGQATILLVSKFTSSINCYKLAYGCPGQTVCVLMTFILIQESISWPEGFMTYVGKNKSKNIFVKHFHGIKYTEWCLACDMLKYPTCCKSIVIFYVIIW